MSIDLDQALTDEKEAHKLTIAKVEKIGMALAKAKADNETILKAMLELREGLHEIMFTSFARSVRRSPSKLPVVAALVGLGLYLYKLGTADEVTA